MTLYHAMPFTSRSCALHALLDLLALAPAGRQSLAFSVNDILKPQGDGPDDALTCLSRDLSPDFANSSFETQRCLNIHALQLLI